MDKDKLNMQREREGEKGYANEFEEPLFAGHLPVWSIEERRTSKTAGRWITKEF
jgi:hypothetical protein